MKRERNVADVNELESVCVAHFLTASGCKHWIAFWRDEGRVKGEHTAGLMNLLRSEKRLIMSNAWGEIRNATAKCDAA